MSVVLIVITVMLVGDDSCCTDGDGSCADGDDGSDHICARW